MDKDPLYFGSKYVEYCGSWDDSRRLNHLNGPMVIIASAGMCEAGRIRHHLRHVVSDPDNAIVIVSYQAEGTLGRQISEGVERVQIFDQWYDLNAAVYVLDGFSGPCRPRRPRLGGTSRPAATSNTPSSFTASPNRWKHSPRFSSRSSRPRPDARGQRELRGVNSFCPASDETPPAPRRRRPGH